MVKTDCMNAFFFARNIKSLLSFGYAFVFRLVTALVFTRVLRLLALRNIPFRLSNNRPTDYYLGVPLNRPLNNNRSTDYYLDK
jgi:hypothetical protein